MDKSYKSFAHSPTNLRIRFTRTTNLVNYKIKFWGTQKKSKGNKVVHSNYHPRDYEQGNRYSPTHPKTIHIVCASFQILVLWSHSSLLHFSKWGSMFSSFRSFFLQSRRKIRYNKNEQRKAEMLVSAKASTFDGLYRSPWPRSPIKSPCGLHLQGFKHFHFLKNL